MIKIKVLPQPCQTHFFLTELGMLRVDKIVDQGKVIYVFTFNFGRMKRVEKIRYEDLKRDLDPLYHTAENNNPLTEEEFADFVTAFGDVFGPPPTET